MDKIVKVGNQFESGHAAGAIISTDGIATTVMENHETITKIKIPQATKCGEIEVSEYGAFDMSYPNSKTRRGRVQGGGNLSPTLTAQHNEIGVVEPVICAVRGREQEDGKLRQKLELNPGTTSNSLTTVQKDNLLCEPIALDEQNRCLRKDGTVGTLTTDGSRPKHNNRIVEPSYRIRKLTPRECWRLMGFSDEDFDRAKAVNSDSQLYKQAGNSIVVDVLMAIFKEML